VKTFFITLLAFVVSFFLGELAAQQVAVAMNGTEEFIAVFGFVFFIAVFFAVAFFVAQLRTDPRRAAGRLARWSIAVLIGLTAVWALWAWIAGMMLSDLPIIAGIMLPALVIVLADWIVVRWLARTAPPAPPRFGRLAN
jgi:amino acid transporter